MDKYQDENSSYEEERKRRIIDLLARLEMELPQPEFEAIKQELLDDLI